MTNQPTASDTQALDALAALLSGKEWDAGTIEAVADLVRQTGREIADFDDRPTWRTEFGADYAVPAEVEAAGLVDHSWSNDACPSFYRHISGDPDNIRDDDLVIWVDHIDPTKRDPDRMSHRFMVTNACGDETFYDGDDVTAALEALELAWGNNG